MIRKAKVCEAKMLFIKGSFTKLLADDNFITLLRAESLATMPQCLWDQLGNRTKEEA
jgi:ParB family chromosome partitioning protein